LFRVPTELAKDFAAAHGLVHLVDSDTVIGDGSATDKGIIRPAGADSRRYHATRSAG
jgi:hypothetical protein